ncbi:hypothetical protein FHT70_000987 [Rhizobium sp. BK049]|nr:hypothetical protein [Rhizobium sp. BK049]
MEQEVACLLDRNVILKFLASEAWRAEFDRQARGMPVDQADAYAVLIEAEIGLLQNVRLVGASAPTVVPDQELSLDLYRFQ